MIILTAAQANRMRGRSALRSYAALYPWPLKDGTFMLPEEVLTDPAHADLRPFLLTLPTAAVDPSNMYDGITDAAAFAALNLPPLQSIGVRSG